MITPILFATELLLLQQSLRDSVDFVQIQNAVLVVRDQPVKNQPKDQQETGSVSFPVSEVGYSHVSLTELRKMVAQGQRTEQNPMQSFVVDRTIGGVNKEKIDDSDQEGGIAGVQTPIDIKFIISSSSLIPPTQLVQFQNAVAEVEKYIESQISTLNLTVTLKLLYTPLTAGRLGVTTVRYSIEQFSTFSYAYDRQILGENEIRPLPLASTLPVRYSGVSTSATPENRIYVVRPLKLALGIPDTAGASTILDDGSITMSSAIQWDFDPSNGLKFGQTLLYSFQDHLVREVAQAMGFVAGADFLVRDCTAMDIFRFQQDVIDETLLVNSATNVFGGAPPLTCEAFSGFYENSLVNGNTTTQFGGWALDYNPGLNKALISKGAALTPPVTPEQMLGAVTAKAGDQPSSMTFLQNQFIGTGSGNTNSFDDAEMTAPAVPSAQRTASYPDGAVQTIKTIGTKCFVIDFRGKIPAAGTLPEINAQISPISAGNFGVGQRYQIQTLGTTDFTSVGAGSNTVGLIFTATGAGTGTGTTAHAFQIGSFAVGPNYKILTRGTSTAANFIAAGATAVTAGAFVIGNPYVISLAGTTTHAQWVTAGATAALPAGLVLGTEYMITAAGTTVWTSCGASANTAGTFFTATAVGSGTGTCVRTNFTAVAVGAGTGTTLKANFAATTVGAAVGTSPGIAALLTDVEFRGAMPRTVARNSVANKSILNFPYGTSGQESDFEMEMYDGSPIRGAFVKQNELASLGTRCLMGESIGKGNTFYSRDYCSYSTTPLALDPLGSRADFLTKREWLALDAMGWNVDMSKIDPTDEGDTSVTLTCP